MAASLRGGAGHGEGGEGCGSPPVVGGVQSGAPGSIPAAGGGCGRSRPGRGGREDGAALAGRRRGEGLQGAAGAHRPPAPSSAGRNQQPAAAVSHAGGIPQPTGVAASEGAGGRGGGWVGLPLVGSRGLNTSRHPPPRQAEGEEASSPSALLPGRGGDAEAGTAPALSAPPAPRLLVQREGREPRCPAAPRDTDRPARRASSVPAPCLCRSSAPLFLAVGPVRLPRDAAQPHRLLPLRLPGEHGQLPARFR